jgi:CheY-like chemotaxis protein
VLDRLKNDVATRHIPVCVISTDESRKRALASGAYAFVAKPIQKRDVLDGLFKHLHDFIGRATRTLLVVESDAQHRQRMLEFLRVDDVAIMTVADPNYAKTALAEKPIDCLVVNAQDSAMADALSALADNRDASIRQLPVIVFDEDGQTPEEQTWKRIGDSCTVRWARSADRLLDLATFFLHRPVAALPESQRQMLIDLHHSDKQLKNKTVLIVDDDIRNIFALSAVLEEHEMKILSTDNGRDAIDLLRDKPEIDIVLMDIMMPEMDGMETMREIRKIPTLTNLPIVAVTAKAMKGDREKCMEAGAWDYLSKPVDTMQMLGVLRAWLHR